MRAVPSPRQPFFAIEALENRQLFSAPGIPAGLRASSIKTTSINVKWHASHDDGHVTGYRVYIDGVKVKATANTNYTAKNLTPGTKYHFAVRAADNEGLFSGLSRKLAATTKGVQAQTGGFSTINAVSFSNSSGVIVDGNVVRGLDNGDWLLYHNINFSSGAKSVKFRLALNPINRGGSIEIRLDSLNGPIIGTHLIQPTGSFSTFLDQSLDINTTSGTHDLYLVIRGGLNAAYLQSLRFGSSHLTRIMPLGDSITQAFHATPSYRWYLWQSLQDKGFNVDFVGSQTQAINGDPPRFDFDQNHEGHSGLRADEIADRAAAWAADAQPDIVLLHAGSNDLEEGQDFNSTLGDLRNIITALRSAVPNVTILLAKIIPDSGNEQGVSNLNGGIPALAASMNTSSSRVIVVDINTGFSEADTMDGIHLTSTGESKMAARWFNALKPLLD